MNRDPTQPNAVDSLLNLPLSVGHLQAEPDLSLISALRDLLALFVYVSCWWIAILFTSSTESEEDRTLSLPALLSTNRLRARRSYLESVFEMEGVPTHVGVVAAERTHMPSLTNSRSSGTSTPIPTAHNDRTGWCDSIDLYFKVKAKRLLNALLWNAANQEFNRITRFAEDLLHQRLVIIVISLNPLLTHSACPYEKRKMCTNHEQEWGTWADGKWGKPRERLERSQRHHGAPGMENVSQRKWGQMEWRSSKYYEASNATLCSESKYIALTLEMRSASAPVSMDNCLYRRRLPLWRLHNN